MKTATSAIESLDSLMSGVNEAVNNLADASRLAAVQWDNLKRVGGARDDHAAALLADVQTRLEMLANFANRCRTQLAEIRAKPFGE